LRIYDIVHARNGKSEYGSGLRRCNMGDRGPKQLIDPSLVTD
jgi:hypothetical protein